jgi:mannose/fructose/N-acetylgalactosamine-specific phosphotransferase system component IIC
MNNISAMNATMSTKLNNAMNTAKNTAKNISPCDAIPIAAAALYISVWVVIVKSFIKKGKDKTKNKIEQQNAQGLVAFGGVVWFVVGSLAMTMTAAMLHEMCKKHLKK